MLTLNFRRPARGCAIFTYIRKYEILSPESPPHWQAGAVCLETHIALAAPGRFRKAPPRPRRALHIAPRAEPNPRRPGEVAGGALSEGDEVSVKLAYIPLPV